MLKFIGRYFRVAYVDAFVAGFLACSAVNRALEGEAARAITAATLALVLAFAGFVGALQEEVRKERDQ